SRQDFKTGSVNLTEGLSRRITGFRTENILKGKYPNIYGFGKESRSKGQRLPFPGNGETECFPRANV
ncbi:MAG: hypothetical protein B5M55_07465, partial [Desulfococcus sp. 4484_242]